MAISSSVAVHAVKEGAAARDAFAVPTTNF
jgi:hypothetical protein